MYQSTFYNNYKILYIVHSKNEPSITQKPDIRSKPGKVKSGSPKKPLTTNSPQKLKTQQKYSPKDKKQKKQKSARKRKYYSSSDSDSDITIKFDDCDLTDDEGKDLDMDEYIERLQKKEKLQEDEVSEEKPNKEELDTQELDTEEVDTQDVDTQELNMQMNTLPIYIRSAGDEDIEIELIDEHEHIKTYSSANGRKKKVAQAKVMSLPDISFQENVNEQFELPSAPLANISQTTNKDDVVFKKPNSVTPQLKAKTISNEPQPGTSKETMEIIKESNNITTNVKKYSPEKAHHNIVTPARITRSRSKDMSPEENTETLAKVTSSLSKDFSPELNGNKLKVKSKDTLCTSIDLETPGNKKTSSETLGMADTNNIPIKKKAKADKDGCITIPLPEDVPRNRKSQFSSTTPIHIGDVDMIEKYLPIHGRTRRILWNKQDPTVGKSFRGTSLTISVGSINSVDSMTTVFHETDENFDYKVTSPNAKENAGNSLRELNSTAGDQNAMKSVERKQISTDTNFSTIDERHGESSEDSRTSLSDLNLATIDQNNVKRNEETKISLLNINSTSQKLCNIEAREKNRMALPVLNATADTNNIKDNTKTKMSLPDLNSTAVEHHHNKNNMIPNKKTGINLTVRKSTTLGNSRKDNENVTKGMPYLNFSTVDVSKETSLPDLNFITADANKNITKKRLADSPKNIKVPAKKCKSSNTSKQVVNSRDIVNSPEQNKTRTRTVSSNKGQMPNLDAVEDMVRVTRRSKVSLENKISDISVSNLTLTPKLKKPDKRQQKQILRKSKFKKMGIIEIADLDTDRTA